jgi:hypothetical protein
MVIYPLGIALWCALHAALALGIYVTVMTD